MGLDGRIYVVGGATPERPDNTGLKILDVLEIYDPATNTWTTGAPMPTPRSRMGVARGGDGRIYVIGGHDESFSRVRVVEAYSPATNSWERVAPLPTVRSFLAVTTSLDGLIYAIGGYDGLGPTKRVDVYSPTQNRWRNVPPTQVVHVGHAAATGRYRVFAIGGAPTQLGEPIATVETRRSFCQVCQ
jgi:N-acetylneuraminic acid mutarotase